MTAFASFQHGPEPAGSATLEHPCLARALLLDRTIELLIEKTKSDQVWPELYVRALELLETLPISTDAYVASCRRLKNALEYALTNGHGAASFELKALRAYCGLQL